MTQVRIAQEIAALERHVRQRGARMRGLGDVATTPITSLSDEQTNQTTALMAIAWALFDAESRSDRMGAASITPVFVSSYNAWNAGIRRIYVNAPASLDPRAAWGTPHDTALTLVLATYAWMQRMTDTQIHTMLSSFPGGAPPNAYRGTWFITQVSGQFQAPVFTHAIAVFRSTGAAGLSSFADSVSQGVDPSVAATPASSSPPRATPAVSTPRTSTPIELPTMTITASSSSPRSATWPWYVLGGVVAIGASVFAYQRIRGAK